MIHSVASGIPDRSVTVYIVPYNGNKDWDKDWLTDYKEFKQPCQHQEQLPQGLDQKVFKIVTENGKTTYYLKRQQGPQAWWIHRNYVMGFRIPKNCILVHHQ